MTPDSTRERWASFSVYERALLRHLLAQHTGPDADLAAQMHAQLSAPPRGMTPAWIHDTPTMTPQS